MTGFDIGTASEVYYGATPVSAIYKGSTKVWPRQAWYKVGEIDLSDASGIFNGASYSEANYSSGTSRYRQVNFQAGICPLTRGHYKAVWSGISPTSGYCSLYWSGISPTENVLPNEAYSGSSFERSFDFNYDAAPSSAAYIRLQIRAAGSYPTGKIEIYELR